MFLLEMADVGYVNTFMPPNYYSLFLRLYRNRHKRKIAKWYMAFENLFGAKDFISEDTGESVENILRYKKRYPALAELFRQADEADIFVINGEGDIVFTTPPRREALFLLSMIELGVRLKKKVFFVNTMISDCPVTGRNIKTLATARRLLSKCQAVAVRDKESLQYVEQEMPEVNSRYIPDSLFSWYPLLNDSASKLPPNGDFLIPAPEEDQYFGKLDFSKPYICIGGGALASNHPEEAERSYEQLFEAVQQLGCSVYLTENDMPDSFLHKIATRKGIGIVPVASPILMGGSVLANARLFISGRYHPSILASLGGTPCIFLKSSAHKMSSLRRLLEYDVPEEFSALPTADDVARIFSLAKKYLEQGDALREKIRKVSEKRCEEALQITSFIQQYI